MKTRIFQKPRLTIVTLTLAMLTGNLLAQEPTTSATTALEQPATVSQPAPQLSYGVPEVLQLAKAKVGDATIINYIQKSGNNYGLNAAQIIYLRQQGVSSAVINAMLDQRAQTQTASAASTASPPAADSGANNTQTTTIVTQPAVTQPAVTYVQTVPTSSVYIIPDTQTYYYNNWLYSHSPFYNCYPTYGYYWPRSTVSVSYIGSRGWVGYRGGYHSSWNSGGYHGGGYHGGSFHGGGYHRGGYHRGGWHH